MNWRALLFWRHPAMLRHVIVNTTFDEVFSGVLWKSRGPYLVLRDTSMLQKSGPPITVDGEVIIDRQKVAFMQAVSP